MSDDALIKALKKKAKDRKGKSRPVFKEEFTTEDSLKQADPVDMMLTDRILSLVSEDEIAARIRSKERDDLRSLIFIDYFLSECTDSEAADEVRSQLANRSQSLPDIAKSISVVNVVSSLVKNLRHKPVRYRLNSEEDIQNSLSAYLFVDYYLDKLSPQAKDNAREMLNMHTPMDNIARYVSAATTIDLLLNELPEELRQVAQSAEKDDIKAVIFAEYFYKRLGETQREVVQRALADGINAEKLAHLACLFATDNFSEAELLKTKKAAIDAYNKELEKKVMDDERTVRQWARAKIDRYNILTRIWKPIIWGVSISAILLATIFGGFEMAGARYKNTKQEEMIRNEAQIIRLEQERKKHQKSTEKYRKAREALMDERYALAKDLRKYPVIGPTMEEVLFGNAEKVAHNAFSEVTPGKGAHLREKAIEQYKEAYTYKAEKYSRDKENPEKGFIERLRAELTLLEPPILPYTQDPYGEYLRGVRQIAVNGLIYDYNQRKNSNQKNSEQPAQPEQTTQPQPNPVKEEPANRRGHLQGKQPE